MRLRSLSARLAAGAVLILVLPGCMKKQPTEIDPTFVPEGRPSALAQLIAWPDAASTLLVFEDRLPIGPNRLDPPAEPGDGDSLIAINPFFRFGPGVNHLMLLDGTPAGAFEVFRRESNGGYARVRSFLINPVRKWIEFEEEVYSFTDQQPSGFTPATYLMRGMVGNQITADSPLSNEAMVSSQQIADLTVTSSLFPSDSLFNIAWQPVTGAAGYWIQVYQFKDAQTSDKIASGVPAPLYVDKSRDFFVGFAPAGVTSYKLGTVGGPVRVFMRRTTLRGQTYFLRVAAVDAAGRLIAFTYGDFGVELGQGEYTLYSLGAKAVQVLSPTPGPAAAREADAGNWIVRAEEVPIRR